MSTTTQVSKWLKRLLLLFGLGAFLFSIALYLATNNIIQIGLGLTITVMILFAVLILMRQSEVSSAIRNLKTQSAALAQYEGDMQQRLETLTQKINTMESVPQLNVDHSEAIEILNSRLNSLQSGSEDRNDANQKRDEEADYHSIDQFPRPAADGVSIQKTSRKRAANPTELNEKSLNMHLQPIVELPSRRPAYFDAFMRLNSNDEDFVEQSEFRKLVETAGLTATIDKKIIFSAVRMIRKLNLLKKRAGVFCPISPKSLLNLNTFREITSFLEANASLSHSLIVEISNRDFSGLNQEQRDRLSELSDLDIGLCLSDVQDLNVDPGYLARFGFRFVKVPSIILLHASVDAAHKGILPTNLASVLSVEGIELIATDVERDRDAINLIDMDLPFAQGLLFAPPRPVKAELLINAEPESPVRLKSSA